MHHIHFNTLLSKLFYIVCAISILILAVGGWQSGKAATGNDNSTLSIDQLAFVTLHVSNQLGIVDRNSHTLIDTIDLAGYGCINPDRIHINPELDQLFILCQASANLVVLSLPDLTLAYILPYSGGGHDDIAFTKNGSHALICGYSQNNVYVLDTSSHEIIQTIPTTNFSPQSMTYNPIKNQFYVVGVNSVNNEGIFVIDGDTFEIVTKINFTNDVFGVVSSLDGQWIYTSDRYGAGIAIIDANTYQVEDTLPATSELTALAIAPDGNTLFAATGFNSSIFVYDLPSRSYVTTIPIGGYLVRDITLDCTGNELYVGNYSAILSVVNTQTYNIDFPIPIPGGTRATEIFPPCGTFLQPPEQSATVNRGESIQFVETLRNYTGITDTFTLSLDDSLWPAGLSDSKIGPLGNGEEITFTITMTVPLDSEWYASNTALVIATSNTNPAGYLDTAALTGQAYAPPQISIIPTSIDVSVPFGSSTIDTLTISNGLGVTLTFEILKPVGIDWLSIEPISGTVQTQDTSPVQFLFDASNLSSGIYTTTITINSNDPTHPAISVPVSLNILDKIKSYLPLITR